MRQSDIGNMILQIVRAEVHAALTDALGAPTDTAGRIPPRASTTPTAQPTSKQSCLTPSETRIADAVRRGFSTCPEIAREIGLSRDSVKMHLSRLARRGTLRRVSRGVYEVAP